MSDLAWPKADTHCPWCGKERSDPLHFMLPEMTCPEIERGAGGLIGRVQVAERMRAEIEVLRGIVQRVRDDWWPSVLEPGWWIGHEEPKEAELMTDAEQIAWYGSVVRQGLEEEPTSALAKAVWRSRGGPPKPRPRGFA